MTGGRVGVFIIIFDGIDDVDAFENSSKQTFMRFWIISRRR
jgi:hypothetical protein